MRKTKWLARQAQHPSGIIGTAVALAMARNTALRNNQAVKAFAPQAGESLLEIGSGHGRTLSLLSAAVAPNNSTPHGFVVGIDPSSVMRREATRSNRADISSATIVVRRGFADAIPFPDKRFDGAISVSCLHFWTDLAGAFSEIRRVLRPAARLLILCSPLEDPVSFPKLPSEVYRLHPINEVEAAAYDSGFESIETRRIRRGSGFAAWLTTRAPN